MKKTVYAIVVDYYHWNEETQSEFTKPLYLGTKHPPKNLYVFDEKFNERSKRWENKDEAIEYFVDHGFTKDGSCYENARIVKVETE